MKCSYSRNKPRTEMVLVGMGEYTALRLMPDDVPERVKWWVFKCPECGRTKTTERRVEVDNTQDDE